MLRKFIKFGVSALALVALAASPMIAMSSTSTTYVDIAYEVPMPLCDLETCDAKDGHCEFDAGYHVPENLGRHDQMAMASQVGSNARVVFTAQPEE